MEEPIKYETPKTHREMLDVIDDFLSRRDAESGNLWEVLTALRSDDRSADDNKKKSKTTAFIRVAAFPKTTSDNYYVDFAGEGSHSMSTTRRGTGYVIQEWSHFGVHANEAARVLGLTKQGDDGMPVSVEVREDPSETNHDDY